MVKMILPNWPALLKSRLRSSRFRQGESPVQYGPDLRRINKVQDLSELVPTAQRRPEDAEMIPEDATDVRWWDSRPR